MELFKLFGRILIDNEDANKKIDQTDAKAEKTGRTLGSMARTAAKWGAGIAAAAGAAGGALLALANRTAQTSSALNDAAARAGTTVTVFQEMRYALTQVGVSESDVSLSLQRLNQRVGEAEEGSSKYARALERLGVSTRNANGEIKTSDELFMELVTRLHEVEDSQLQAALAGQIFGVNLAQRLLPAIKAGGEEIANLRNRAHELGIVMEEDGVQAAADFASMMDEVRMQLGSISQRIMLTVMPTLRAWLEWTVQHAPKVGAVFQFIGEVIEIVFRYMRLIIGDAIRWMRDTVIGPFTEWLTSVWQERGPPIIEAVQALWEGVKQVFSGVFDALRSLWDAFVAAFQGDWETAWQRIKDAFAAIWNTIPALYEGIFTPLLNILDNVAEIIIDGIRNLFGDEIADHVQAVWDGIVGVLEAGRDIILAVWRAITAAFQGDWQGAWDEIKRVPEIALTAITDLVEAGLNALNSVIDWLLDGIVALFHSIFADEVATVVSASVELWRTIIQSASDLIMGVLRAFLALFRGDWEGAWEEIVSTFRGIWDRFTDWFSGPLDAAIPVIVDWVVRLINVFRVAKDMVLQRVREMAQGVAEWLGETKLGKTFKWLGEQVEKVAGWFFSLYDRVVGHSYIPDMVEEIGEAIERLRERLANPVARYTAQALASFEGLSEGAAEAAYSIAEAFDQALSTMSKRLGDVFTDITAEFFHGTATWQGILDQFAGFIGSSFRSLFNSLATELAKNIIAQNTWLTQTLANVATAVTAYLSQAFAALTAFFWWAGPAAPVLAGGVIAAAVAAIAALSGQVIRTIMPGLGGGSEPPGDDRGRDTGRSPGRQVSEITGPTRDLLTSLLSPLARLDEQTGILGRIYDVLDARLPMMRDMAFAGAPQITVQVYAGIGADGRRIGEDVLDVLEEELSDRLGYDRRGESR